MFCHRWSATQPLTRRTVRRVPFSVQRHDFLSMSFGFLSLLALTCFSVKQMFTYYYNYSTLRLALHNFGFTLYMFLSFCIPRRSVSMSLFLCTLTTSISFDLLWKQTIIWKSIFLLFRYILFAVELYPAVANVCIYLQLSSYLHHLHHLSFILGQPIL